jgi:hypothetical protein
VWEKFWVEGVNTIFGGRHAHSFVMTVCVDDVRKTHSYVEQYVFCVDKAAGIWNRNLFTAEFQNKWSPTALPLTVIASTSQCTSDSTLLTIESLLCVSLGKRKLFISSIFKYHHKHKFTHSTVRPVRRAWSGHKLQQWHLTSGQRSQLQTYWKIQSRSVDKGWNSRLRLRGMVTTPKSYRDPALAAQWIFVVHKTIIWVSVQLLASQELRSVNLVP